MITYPIADNKRPNRYYYGIVLSLKDSHSMSETRAYIPFDELDEMIANLIKHKKQLQ
jgi:hypothetical protein